MPQGLSVLICSLDSGEFDGCLASDRRIKTNDLKRKGVEATINHTSWSPHSINNLRKFYSVGETLPLKDLLEMKSERERSPETYPEWAVVGAFERSSITGISKIVKATTMFARLFPVKNQPPS